MVTIKKYSKTELTRGIKKELRSQLVVNFPTFPCFKTRHYYHIPPDYVFIAYIGNKIAGFRYVTYKTVNIDKKMYKIAAIGISIKPKHQGKGIGQLLTKNVIEYLHNQKIDFVIATTDNPAAIHILKKNGFAIMNRKFKYRNPYNKKICIEKYAIFAKDFDNGKLIKKLEDNKTPINTGIGSV